MLFGLLASIFALCGCRLVKYCKIYVLKHILGYVSDEKNSLNLEQFLMARSGMGEIDVGFIGIGHMLVYGLLKK